ncbi:meiotic sister-chromatid recombination aldehyde dehydrogenase [Dacryopinax primogenitus]|uniref:Meiotic sister-chromatid recombination aldehyde dehydrogenase n=1 Tax=Dacryopinax primogenitus (strain DJM 731) TaxID=1858805 RepID=M5G2G7_DACPD|nr:meiotic sister-chromatid recombination aldehyde dehydrogenase [Dacryopinax primogenitus]EJU02884.1 meiotic sister-chromatid recombination aldehyde dehydrogenase [Dacryopinax primogenitus]
MSMSASPSMLLTALLGFIISGILIVVRRHDWNRKKSVKFEWAAPEQSFLNYEGTTILNPTLKSHLEDPALLPAEHEPGVEYITCFDPSTSLHISTLPSLNQLQIAERISLARESQRTWSQSTFDQRRRVMRSLLAWVLENSEGIARVACRDTGKTMIDAAFGEILTTCAKLEWVIKYGEKELRPSRRRVPLLLMHKKAHVYYEPKGVVAAVVSWNYPIHNALGPIIAALFAGNAILLKASEQVAWSSTWVIGAVRQCLQACGHDPDVVQLVLAYPETVETLTRSPVVRHITFIGSEEVGRKVLIAAADNLTPVTLELGGKDAAILLPSADLKAFSSHWMRGVFQSMGQNCIGIERFIVHSSIYDQFLSLMLDRVRKLRMGSVLNSTPEGWVSTIDVGSLISHAHAERIARIVARAREEGAEVLTGGNVVSHPYAPGGAWFEPTVIANVTEEMDIARLEVFGPVMVVMRYEGGWEEAVRLANGCTYGLGASVFGNDRRECERVVRALRCGMVAVNDFGVFYLNQDLPFGGVKSSGFGRFSGPEGLQSLCDPKSVIQDRYFSWIRTPIPRAVDYPIRSLVSSWEFVAGLGEAVWGEGWAERVGGVWRLVKA